MDSIKRLLISAFAAFALQASAQNISGIWNGELNAGIQKIPLVLNLTTDGKCTLDSPQQGAKGIPADIVFISADSLNVSLKALNASFAGKLQDGELKGVFTQHGFKLPLNLKPGERAAAKRPQTPKPPYPYQTEEVTFVNAQAGATLAGTLTLPQDARCVVLMVTGSGQQNRDEELFEHKPFAVIADYLARQGIATLRYDDRATGASVGGEVKSATTRDFMGDAAAGLDFLRSRKTFDKVGILGHSEGGAIAFMLGAQQKPDFVISLAGPGVKGDTLLAAQANRILALHGMPESMTVEKYRQQQSIQSVPWIKWFMDYDPTDDIRRTHCPVMAINGDRDYQVISSQNLTAIRQLLPPSEKNLIKEYPSLNHLFQHCQTGLPTEYGVIEETISQEVLKDIADWLKQVVDK
jgi:pimeloyl-ACP methyl ester carboxylesterase